VGENKKKRTPPGALWDSFPEKFCIIVALDAVVQNFMD